MVTRTTPAAEGTSMDHSQDSGGDSNRDTIPGVESPREVFDRLTRHAFTPLQYDHLVSVAALAKLIGQYKKLGDLFDEYQTLFDDLHRLREELKEHSASEEWRCARQLVQRDRSSDRSVLEYLLREGDAMQPDLVQVVLRTLVSDPPESIHSDLLEHIDTIHGLTAMFVKLSKKKGPPVNLERYVFVIAIDLLAHAGVLPGELTGREFALVSEDIGFERLPEVDISDVAGNIQEGRGRLEKQWNETVSSARGKKATKLSEKSSGIQQTLKKGISAILKEYGVDTGADTSGHG